MMKGLFVLIGMVILCSTLAQKNQEMAVLYDPRTPTQIPEVASDVRQRIFKDILRVGSSDLRARCLDGNPLDQPEIKGVTTGSFTRVRATQTAYVLELCGLKVEPDQRLFGVAIYEARKIVAYSHVHIPTAGGIVEAYGVRDINLNSLSELAVVWGTGDGFCPDTSLTLLEFKQSVFAALGEAKVLRYFETSQDKDPCSELAIYVNKSTNPTFVGIELFLKRNPVLLKLEKSALELTNFKIR
jgi:hypothetical protein